MDKHDSSSDDDSFNIKKLIKKEDKNTSDGKKAQKHHYKGSNYERIIKLCNRANVEVANGHKLKEYPQLIEACHKKKKDHIKNFSMDISKFGSKQGYEEDCTPKIVNTMNRLHRKMKLMDKLIGIIEYEIKESDKRYDISNFMNMKPKKKSVGLDISSIDGEPIDKFSV
jgi:hypothetical protein